MGIASHEKKRVAEPLPRERRAAKQETLIPVERYRDFEISPMSRPSLPGGPQGNDVFRVLTRRPGRWTGGPPKKGGPDDEDAKLKHQARNYAGIASFIGVHIVSRLSLQENAFITGTFLTPVAKVVAPLLTGYAASRLFSAYHALRSGQYISGGVGMLTSGASLLGGVMLTAVAAFTGYPPAVVGAGGFWIGMYIGSQNGK